MMLAVVHYLTCHLRYKLPSKLRKRFFSCVKVWLIYPQQVQTLVIRSLSNALVLPWPNKADNEQVRIEVNVRFHMDITRSMALWKCSILRF